MATIEEQYGECASLAAFYAAIEAALASCGESSSVALLVVSLRRSDRIAALLADHQSEQVTLQLLAHIKAILRSKDQFVLAGEDECWLLLPGLPSEALAILAAHRLLAALNPPLMVGKHTVFMRPCVGIACAPLHAQSAASLLRAADIAQQNARAANNLFSMAETAEGGGSIPADLPKALSTVLASNALKVVYQPKVDIRTMHVASVEALVRWPNDDAQFVPTDILIEAAERSGLIEPLTLHVLNTALREYAIWKNEGMEIRVWVNLSAKLLSQQQLPQRLSQVLSVWGLPSSVIGFEITESALIHDIEQTTEMLFELRRLGFHLSIDDFGTGYSSLAYLRRFPIDELKIDKIFVQGMAHSIQDKQIVQSIIDLAHNFGLSVVAEGVELPETLPELLALGCDQVQGFIYAKPMAADALLAWWREFNRFNRMSESVSL
jgi:predicted signal transduction protein with EAL and GGDEF domain